MPTERRQHARLNAPQGAIWRRIGHRISNPAVEGSNPSGSVSFHAFSLQSAGIDRSDLWRLPGRFELGPGISGPHVAIVLLRRGQVLMPQSPRDILEKRSTVD